MIYIIVIFIGWSGTDIPYTYAVSRLGYPAVPIVVTNSIVWWRKLWFLTLKLIEILAFPQSKTAKMLKFMQLALQWYVTCYIFWTKGDKKHMRFCNAIWYMWFGSYVIATFKKLHIVLILISLTNWILFNDLWM